MKSDTQNDRELFLTLLHVVLEDLRVCGILLQPIVPATAKLLLNRLGIPQDKRTLASVLEPHVGPGETKPLGPDTGLLITVEEDKTGKKEKGKFK